MTACAGDAVAAEALAWLGTPYRHQASLRGAGADCLGLVRGIWRAVHGSEAEPMPAYGPDWRDGDGTTLEAAARRHLIAVAGPPETGDVVLFAMLRHRPARHCGVMVGATRFVHAQEHAGVIAVEMTQGWRRRIACVFRIPAPPNRQGF